MLWNTKHAPIDVHELEAIWQISIDLPLDAQEDVFCHPSAIIRGFVCRPLEALINNLSGIARHMPPLHNCAYYRQLNYDLLPCVSASLFTYLFSNLIYDYKVRPRGRYSMH